MVHPSVGGGMDEFSGHWAEHGEEVGIGPAFEVMHAL